MQCKSLASWSKAVKEMSGYKCTMCGVSYNGDIQTRIESHHIEIRSLHPDLALDLNNGIALCHRCHRIIHGDNYTARHYPQNFMQADFDEDAKKHWNNVWVGGDFVNFAAFRKLVQDYINNRMIIELEIDINTYEEACAHISNTGEAITDFILRSISETIKNDNGQ